MIDLSTHTETCSYCFKGYSDGLSICFCGDSLCSDHLDFHCSKFNCGILYKLVKENSQINVISHDNNLMDEEKTAIELKINEFINNKRSKMADLKVCEHFNPLNNISMSFSDRECCICKLNDNIWACLQCGNQGCERVQPGVSGNGHALEHFYRTGHSQVVLLNKKLNDIFCYQCGQYVQLPNKININFCNNILSDKKSFESDSSHITGIENENQNCYINSVLHLLKQMIDEKNLTEHFKVCENNPAKCFICQLVKIMNSLYSDRIYSINISDFLNIVYKTGVFVRNKQEDSSEFLQFVIDKIQEEEKRLSISNISDIYKFKIKDTKRCLNCGYSNEEINEGSILYLPLSANCHSLDSCFRNYFKPFSFTCKCGKNGSGQLRMVNLPEKLIVSVMRYEYKDNCLQKLFNKLDPDNVQAISLDDEKELYSVIGCVTHKGALPSSGHYVYWSNDDKGCFLVNDSIVNKSTIDDAAEGTLYLLQKLA